MLTCTSREGSKYIKVGKFHAETGLYSASNLNRGGQQVLAAAWPVSPPAERTSPSDAPRRGGARTARCLVCAAHEATDDTCVHRGLREGPPVAEAAGANVPQSEGALFIVYLRILPSLATF